MARAYVHLSGCREAGLDVRWLWDVHAESDSSLHNGHLKMRAKLSNLLHIHLFRSGRGYVSEGTTLGGWERGGGAPVAEYSMRIGILWCFQEMLRRSVAYELLAEDSVALG